MTATGASPSPKWGTGLAQTHIYPLTVMSAIAGMPVSLELEARRREEQERRTRVYIRVWREEGVVLKNG